MGEVDWGTPIVATVVGLLIGAILMFLLKESVDEASERAGRDGRLEDLRREKDRLLQALRDLEDTGSKDVTERTELELAAAEVFREIEGLEGKGRGKGKGKGKGKGPGSPGGKAAAAAEDSRPEERAAGTGLSPELLGMLKGGGVVAFLALIGWLVVSGSRDRAEGDSMTGGDSITMRSEVRTRVPGEGETGGATPDVPPDLRPQVSAAVDAARAKVASDPGTVDHWIELGYALVEAEGWIDAWQTAQEIEQRVPGHPEGKVIMGIVRIAMGMTAQADALFDEALEAQPNHLVALSYKGMIAFRSGDAEGAKSIWTLARSVAPPEDQAMFDELLAMAEQGAPPVSPGSQTPPDHPPMGDAPAPASGARIEGRIELAEGATPPPGGTIYVIARHKGATAGPPAATKRLSTRDLPATFTLDDSNVMMGGPFPAEVELTVRFDADGNAMTKTDGDLVGGAGVVQSGASGVVIVLAPPQ